MIAKDEAASDLAVRVQGNSITVAKFGTDFFVTSRVTTLAVSEFRVRAFQMAVAKARELGWII